MAPKNRVSTEHWNFNDLIFVRNSMHALALWDYAFLCAEHPLRGHPMSIFLGFGAKRYYSVHNYPIFYKWSLATEMHSERNPPPDSQRANIFKIFEAVEICRNFLALNVNIYLEFNSKMWYHVVTNKWWPRLFRNSTFKWASAFFFCHGKLMQGSVCRKCGRVGEHGSAMPQIVPTRKVRFSGGASCIRRLAWAKEAEL